MSTSTPPLTVPVAAPDPDVVAEARRLLAGALEQEVPVRLIGGLAVRLHVSDMPAAFAREYKDIDLVTSGHGSQTAARFAESMGYVPSPEFNALNGHRRLLFADLANERRLDVFVGRFTMCHELPIAERLHLDPVSVPLAELLLTKLQIVELNERDLKDILAIVHGHEVASHDDDAINADLVAELCATDWGLWRTCTSNLERAHTGTLGYPMAEPDREVIDRRIHALRARIDAEPKSGRWKLRSRIGDRKRWYELPEEVD